jgi:hypothetical protein
VRHLPDEILQRIVTFVCFQDQLARQKMACVCRRWRRIVKGFPPIQVHVGWDVEDYDFQDGFYVCRAAEFFEQHGPYSGRSQALRRYLPRESDFNNVNLYFQRSDSAERPGWLTLVRVKLMS